MLQQQKSSEIPCVSYGWECNTYRFVAFSRRKDPSSEANIYGSAIFDHNMHFSYMSV